MAVKKATIKKSPARAKKPVLTKTASAKVQATQISQSPLSSLTEKQRRALTLGILVVLILGALAYYYKGKFVAATVNGKPILRSAVVQQLEKQGGKQTLDSLIAKNLVEQEAKKRGIAVSDDEVLKKINDSLKAQGQTLEAVLQAQGLTKEYVIDSARLQFLLEKMLAEKTKATDKEISEFIEKNKSVFPEGTKEEDMKKQAKAQVENQKFSTEAQKLITDLKAKAKINTYAQY